MRVTILFACAIVASTSIVNAELTGKADPDLKTWKADQKKIQDEKDAKAADQKKMAAVDKVVSMLEDLQQKVVEEGEAEAETYDKFACFCKTTSKKKSEAISKGKDDKASLSADIKKLSKERDDLDDLIKELSDAIKKAEKEMEKATKESDAALAVYKTNEADLSAALSGLKDAIAALKSSKKPSLVQLQSMAKTVKQAALMADVLGLGGDATQKAASFFLQQSDSDVPVEMEDYKFHSSGIIGTLEKLLGDFRKEKASLDADEVKRVQKYNMFIQDRTDLVKAKTHELEDSKKTKEQKIEDIGTASQELTTVSATLLDDMEYLDELNKVCSEKAKTWDQRTKLRANELTAIVQAKEIVKDTVAAKTAAATVRLAQQGSTVHLASAVTSSESAMDAIEAEAEISEEDSGAPVGFLQKRSVSKHDPDFARQMIISLLGGKGKELKSTLLTTLATRIAADPFAKIKKLIQELIERLLTEAANEANQKGWCDKATADATQKRTYAAEEIEADNAKMAKLEALSDKLGEELKILVKEIKELKDAQADAQKQRKEEKAENAHTVQEAKLGLAAVTKAIDILDKFYKTSAKAKVDLKLVQGPLDDAPDAGFDNGEAYKGAAAASGGIVGMMEVIQSDFERTISETKKEEKKAEQEHLEFMTESSKSLAEKTMAEKEKTKLKDEADQNLNDTEDNMNSQTKILVESIKELIELKKACVDTGMSYADRVAMREQEIASLKKALCIFGAYAEYGPDGLADAC